MRELNEKTKVLLSVGAVVLLAVVMLIFVSLSTGGDEQGKDEGLTVSTEEKEDKDDNLLIIGDGSTTDIKYEGVELYSLAMDFTGDGNDETLTAYYVGDGDSSENIDTSLKNKKGYLNFIIEDTVHGKLLYTKKVSNNNGEMGELAAINYANGGAILEGSIKYTDGRIQYTYNVFNFENEKKNLLDSYDATAVTSNKAAFEEQKKGKGVHSYLEIAPDYRESIEIYFPGSVLLAACENIPETTNRVLYSTKDTKKTMKDFYDPVWEVVDDAADYFVAVNPNVFGEKAYIVEEDMSLYTMDVFNYVYNENGELLAEIVGDYYIVDCDGDGSNEIVTNSVYSDGAQLVYVFTKKNGKVVQGNVADMLPFAQRNLEELWTEYAIYKDKEKQVEIYEYSDDIGDYNCYKKKIDLSKINFVEQAL